MVAEGGGQLADVFLDSIERDGGGRVVVQEEGAPDGLALDNGVILGEGAFLEEETNVVAEGAGGIDGVGEGVEIEDLSPPLPLVVASLEEWDGHDDDLLSFDLFGCSVVDISVCISSS